MLLLFDPIAFLDYISLFLSQGDINNLFSPGDEEGENFKILSVDNKMFIKVIPPL